MPPGPQLPSGHPFHSGYRSAVQSGSSCSHPLVFGTWPPEDFDSLSSEASGAMTTSMVVNAPVGPGFGPKNGPASTCGTPPEGLLQTYEHAIMQHEVASDPACNALHFLMGENCGQMPQDHITSTAPDQPIVLVPAELPFSAPQLLQMFGGIHSLLVASPTTLPAWSMPQVASLASTAPYLDALYACGPGFWLHGMYFPSYEHFVAYRRRAIAYNFHYFGIRPHFRPPPGLPRARPPALALPSKVEDVTAARVVDGGSTSSVSDAFNVGSSTAALKPSEDGGESCSSPGSSSTCSNGDSDDTSSDNSHPDPEMEISEAQHDAGVSRRQNEAGSPVERAAKSSQEHDEHERSGIQEGIACVVMGGHIAALDWEASGACTCSTEQRLLPSASGGFVGLDELPKGLSLPPVRCGNSFDDLREEARYVSGCVAGGALHIHGVCSYWLERHFRLLLDSVVDDALRGGDDVI